MPMKKYRVPSALTALAVAAGSFLALVVFTSPAPNQSSAESSFLPVAQAQTASAGRTIRAGLSTSGSSIQLMAQGAMTITDSAQPGRRLAVKAGEVATFIYGANRSVAARGAAYSGPITIRTDGGTFPGWRVARVWANGNRTRVSSDGKSPRWQRPYRGHFEIAPQTYSFEPAKHKSPLRVVNIVPLEEYLKGVVPWEMNRSAPLEALKAQAICARSETLYKIGNGRHARDGYDICDYDHCQGYPGVENESPRTTQAVEQTNGLVMYHNGKIADAVYGTNSGGITAASEDVWQGAPRGYLQRRVDASPQTHPGLNQYIKPTMTESDWVRYCTTNLPSFGQPNAEQVRTLASRRASSPRTAALFQSGDLPEFYRWSRVINPYTLAKALAPRHNVRMNYVSSIRVEERAPSGHIKRLLITGSFVQNGKTVSTAQVRLSGDSQIRGLQSGRLGSTTALPSSTFVIQPRLNAKKQLEAFVLRGAGWGHGVGMCQRGAQNRALAGWNARQIIEFYYQGIELRKIG